MEKKPLKPAEILDFTINVSQDKAAGSFRKLFVLGILAGAFIAFAAEGSNMAAFNLFANPETYGLGKALAGVVFGTGLLTSGGGMLGAVTLKIAVYKVNLSFLQAFYLGIMCNWLVCLAVWISFGAETMTGKIFSIFFPIWLFITSGFEHSVANMYYIPAGILIKANTAFAELAGLTPEALDSLTWGSFAVHNLIPVTLGNIVGGGIFVGMVYWYAYKKA